MKDLEIIANKANLPLSHLKDALGIPVDPCSAVTILEAQLACQETESGSDKGRAARAKRRQLLFKEIEAATNYPVMQGALIAKACGLEAFKECIAALTILQKLYFTEHPVEHADK